MSTITITKPAGSNWWQVHLPYDLVPALGPLPDDYTERVDVHYRGEVTSPYGTSEWANWGYAADFVASITNLLAQGTPSARRRASVEAVLARYQGGDDYGVDPGVDGWHDVESGALARPFNATKHYGEHTEDRLRWRAGVRLALRQRKESATS